MCLSQPEPVCVEMPFGFVCFIFSIQVKGEKSSCVSKVCIKSRGALACLENCVSSAAAVHCFCVYPEEKLGVLGFCYVAEGRRSVGNVSM